MNDRSSFKERLAAAIHHLNSQLQSNSGFNEKTIDDICRSVTNRGDGLLPNKQIYVLNICFIKYKAYLLY